MSFMNSSPQAIAMIITWAGFGVKIESVDETVDSLKIYISVPKSSVQLNAHNEQMAGDLLAKKFKQTLEEMGVKRLTVLRKIRDEHWTEELRQQAETEMRKELLGSQW